MASNNKVDVENTLAAWKDGKIVPNEEEIQRVKESFIASGKSHYKRNLFDRIFVSRDLRMDRIMYFGFDMDYSKLIICFFKLFKMIYFDDDCFLIDYFFDKRDFVLFH